MPASARCGTDEVLLTALGLAVTCQRQSRGVDASSVLVHVERHGRDESLVPGTDLTRTVGWFTTAHPVRIALRTVDLADADAIGAALAAVKEQLRAVPDHGIGYGMLRYWDPGGAVLRDRPFGQIGFNYLGWATLGGQVRTGAGGGWLPVIDPDQFVVPVVPDMPVRVPLQIDAIVLDAGDGPRLTVWFGYASGVLAESDVRDLAQRWTVALDALAAHSTPPGGGATHRSVPAVAVAPTDIDVHSSRYGSTASRSCRPPRRHEVGSKKGSW